MRLIIQSDISRFITAVTESCAIIGGIQLMKCQVIPVNIQNPRYFIRTPYNGVLASQTRHDFCPQSSMIRGVMSPGLVGRW